MKKIKEEKGITLVALIITIVVLLILAMAGIGAIQDSKIIAHAQNAAKSFNQSKANETIDLTKYEEEIEKYVPGEKKEYLPGTDLRLNATYYLSGKDTEYITLFFYANGTVDYINNWDEETPFNNIPYVVEEGKVTAAGYELVIIKAEKNDILIKEDENLLFSTSTNGLKYFNGEKYEFDNEGYHESILLESDGGYIWSKGWGGTGTDAIPVFYNGKVYGASMYDADENIYEITSTDNCETLICKGNTFTKVQE